MTTQNKALNQPAYNSSAWDAPLNNNFGYIDASLGNTATISDNTGRALTTTEYQSMRLYFSGTLSSDQSFSIPSGVGGFWIVTNRTSDSSAAVPCYLTITSGGGGTSVTIPRSISGTVLTNVTIYSDGTNINYTNNSLTPAGTVISHAGATAPTGYVSCDGTALSRSTYSTLFAAIGTTWGSGNGTTTFNIPDLRGYFLRGSGTSSVDPSSPRAVGSTQAQAYLSHTHTDSGHTHGYSAYDSVRNADGSGSPFRNNAIGANTSTGYANIQASGGAETRPVNIAILYCIKF
jgi:microcystin-dependent protein